jgi:hypothetical protein
LAKRASPVIIASSVTETTAVPESIRIAAWAAARARFVVTSSNVRQCRCAASWVPAWGAPTPTTLRTASGSDEPGISCSTRQRATSPPREKATMSSSTPSGQGRESSMASAPRAFASGSSDRVRWS